MDPDSEPAPFDPACRRWLPDLAFPDHRFLPGTTARHAVALTAGMPVECGAPVAAIWRDSRRYLAGVDHFNFAYWWEAHEFWEELWRAEKAGSDCRCYLRGLIQVAAALLKWHAGNAVGMGRLAYKAAANLGRLAGRESYMGVSVPDLRARVANLQAAAREFAAARESAVAGKFATAASRLRRPGLAPVIHLHVGFGEDVGGERP